MGYEDCNPTFSSRNAGLMSTKHHHTMLFSSFTVELLEEMFGVIPQPTSPHLDHWLHVSTTLPPATHEVLAHLQQKLISSVLVWNEEELKVKFIATLLNLVDYDTDYFQSFLERELVVTIDQTTIRGVVDWMVARGRFAPKKQFFCLHDYKQERTNSRDPLGQLVIAMLAARHLNQDDSPMYGAYVVGRNWFFVVLDGQYYTVSLAYDATKDEILAIYAILQRLKELLLAQAVQSTLNT
jgi:hypothetical protein